MIPMARNDRGTVSTDGARRADLALMDAVERLVDDDPDLWSAVYAAACSDPPDDLRSLVSLLAMRLNVDRINAHEAPAPEEPRRHGIDRECLVRSIPPCSLFCRDQLLLGGPDHDIEAAAGDGGDRRI